MLMKHLEHKQELTICHERIEIRFPNASKSKLTEIIPPCLTRGEHIITAPHQP